MPEKDIVGGVEIIANLKLALREAVSQLAQLEKRGIVVKPTIDASGVKDGVVAVAEEAAKIKFDAIHSRTQTKGD